MTRKWMLTFALAAVAMLVATNSFAAKLNIGDAAPGWSGTGVDDEQHSLSDYKDAKAIVLVFTCNHCPVAVAYQDRLIALQKDYKAKGVQVIAVSANDAEAYPADSFEKMKVRAKQKGFNFPYVYDKTQKIARDYGATCTPHAFLLCKERKIAYQGAIDDNNKPDKAEKHYLADAIDAVLAGNEPPETVTKQRGCSIKWSKKT